MRVDVAIEYTIASVKEKAQYGKSRVCGYDRSVEALEFHHIDPSQKTFGIAAKGYTNGWDKMKAELDKCVLLCSNCHKEVEAGIVEINTSMV